ncbi:IS5 family transposase [Streptomyces sp. PR69]|uniref:IS5 family transposase n=1 Tax=Streptomyces sp. PR69 TaxID=2984950 RepID=UPI00226445CE|nr:IS5 family transposase [Streptomyces sp. PR69]
MIRRHELSDAEWDLIRPLLPRPALGRPRLDDRMVLNGIVWKFRTGVPWRDVPKQYGPWATLHTRFRRWRRTARSTGYCEPCRRRRTLQATSTDGVGRLHDHPWPPARGRGPKRGRHSPALGRSRGGLTSKIHLACDAIGRPLAFVLTGGNTNDCTQFTAVMDAIKVPRLGPGRPRLRPDHVIADKGYSSKAIRTWLRRRGIAHTIPERADQVRNRARKGSLGGRPPVFDKEVYKHRNVVERCFNRLKQWRGIATRYDKTAESYKAAITLASILMWA